VTKVVAQQAGAIRTGRLARSRFCEDDAARLLPHSVRDWRTKSEVKTTMNMKTKLTLGILTALAMLVLTFALPRGDALRDAQLAQFPVTVGVWAVFVLLFVKLK
jgi:hypothetical protein